MIRMRPLHSILAAWLAMAILTAQDGELRVRGPSPGVVRLGDQARVELTVEGDAKAGGLVLPKVDGLTLQAFGPSRQEQSYFDGRRMTHSIQTTWTVVVQPQREGKFAIPPLQIEIDGKPQRTQTLAVEAVRDVTGDKYGFLKVQVAKQRVYVHEPIRVTFDYGIDATLSPVRGRAQGGQQYYDIELTAPWLDAPDGAVVIEEAKQKTPPGETLSLVGNRKLLEVVYEKGYERQGRPYHHFVLERSYLPLRVGTLKLDGPMLRFQVASGRNQRSLFDPFFEEANGTNYYVYARPLEVEVLPIPEQGRPMPYLGAVGRFAIVAKCEQPRIKQGAVLRLTFAIRGEGNLEFLGVPALDDWKGLHLLGKKEERTKESVTVTYDLRVVAADVKEIPPITYSWFDTTPGVEKFTTEKTAAIPIEVVPLQPGEGLAPSAGSESKAVTPGVDDIFDIKSLAGGPAVVLARAPSPSTAALWLVLPWLGLATLAYGWRKLMLRRSDERGRRVRGARRRCEASLASGDAHGALVGFLADRFDLTESAVIAPDLARVLVAKGAEPELAARLSALVERGLAARYGGGGGVSSDEVRRVVGEVEATRTSLASPTTVATLCAFLALCGFARAQEQDAVSAYRKGDYAQAATLFAKAVAEPGADRRLHYDLGNSLYRSGKLAAALHAYECARLAMPRDPELNANIALVKKKLDLVSQEGESFATALTALREALTPLERFWCALLCGTLAAATIVFGRRGLRWLGLVLLAPFTLFALEVLLLGPRRAQAAIVLVPESSLVAEPRRGLTPILQLKAGVSVDLLSQGQGWARVGIAGKFGYLPQPEIAVVE